MCRCWNRSFEQMLNVDKPYTAARRYCTAAKKRRNKTLFNYKFEYIFETWTKLNTISNIHVHHKINSHDVNCDEWMSCKNRWSCVVVVLKFEHCGDLWYAQWSRSKIGLIGCCCCYVVSAIIIPITTSRLTKCPCTIGLQSVHSTYVPAVGNKSFSIRLNSVLFLIGTLKKYWWKAHYSPSKFIHLNSRFLESVPPPPLLLLSSSLSLSLSFLSLRLSCFCFCCCCCCVLGRSISFDGGTQPRLFSSSSSSASSKISSKTWAELHAIANLHGSLNVNVIGWLYNQRWLSSMHDRLWSFHTEFNHIGQNDYTNYAIDWSKPGKN